MSDDGIFLKNSWYVAAWDHELIDGRKLARTILEKPLVIYRGASGKVVALDDRCCHRAAPLSMGRIEGDDIRCMYHGMKFDPGGKCIQIPGQDTIPPKLGVRSYPAVERYNLIWIWPGDADKADPDSDRRLSPARRRQMARRSRIHALQGELAPDRRQSERLRASGFRAYPHARRFRGVRLQDQAGRGGKTGRRFSRRALAHECRAAALSQEGHFEPDRQHRPPQHRPHDHSGHFPARHHVRAGGQGRGEGRSGRRHTPISQRPVHDAGDARLELTSSGTICTTSTPATRTSRCRCETAWKKPSTRTRRSSRRSRRCSTPIRIISCWRSARTQPSPISAGRWRGASRRSATRFAPRELRDRRRQSRFAGRYRRPNGSILLQILELCDGKCVRLPAWSRRSNKPLHSSRDCRIPIRNRSDASCFRMWKS